MIPIATPTGFNLTWTNQPVGVVELTNSQRYRTSVDLTNATQARIVVNVMTAGTATSNLCVEYSTNEAAWFALDGVAGPCVGIGASGVKRSSFAAIAAGAKSDVFLRVVGKLGDAVADPAFGQISLQVK